MKSETLEEILKRRLDSIHFELLNTEVDSFDEEYSALTALEVSMFLKEVALEASNADLLLKATQVDALARKIYDQELNKYQDDFEDDLDCTFNQSEEWEEQRQGWQRLVGFCNEKILNTEAYFLDLSDHISIFKEKELELYNLGVGHKIDNYLSRQNTQYRVFMICKGAVISKYSGVKNDFPSCEEFDQIFEGAKSRVLINSENYINKHISKLKATAT